ncbi:MAG: FAD:protein FMN transferase [Candidatus Gracilibacteria bacterium]|nr:FAD:protein FMN transferase [Candidatus Gracilibacteria bacterium]
MQYTETRKLLGTSIEVRVVSEDPKTPERIGYVFDYFSSVEQEFSRFLPDSDLSLLNRHKKMSVSKRFLELMYLSKKMYAETDGFFNPLVSVAKLGYRNSFEQGKFEAAEGVVNTDFDAVRITDDVITLEPGQALDFGGIGKGWAVDKGSELLRLFGYDNFFINAGGDIYASGNRESSKNGWIIGIENPFTEEVIASIVLQDAAIATSGSYKRKWDMNQQAYHHLINPKTLGNEHAIVSVTLISPECARCDGFTKSVFNAPVSEGIRLIEQHGMDGLIFTSAGELLSTKGLSEKYELDFVEN